VTSVLGGRFPVGYKVARITDVVQDANEPFMNVSGETIAKVELIKDVLLLWNSDHLTNPRPPHSEQEENGAN